MTQRRRGRRDSAEKCQSEEEEKRSVEEREEAVNLAQQFMSLTQSHQEHKERHLQLRAFVPLCEANRELQRLSLLLSANLCFSALLRQKVAGKSFDAETQRRKGTQRKTMRASRYWRSVFPSFFSAHLCLSAPLRQKWVVLLCEPLPLRASASRSAASASRTVVIWQTSGS